MAYQTYGIGLGYNYQVTNSFKVLAKLGIAKLENDVEDGISFEQVNDTTVYTSFGLDYEINQKESWLIEYDYFDEDFQMISAGYKFSF